MRILASLALAACVATCSVLIGCATDRAGGAAPAFSAVDSNGDTVSLAAYEGHVLILDFWAVW